MWKSVNSAPYSLTLSINLKWSRYSGERIKTAMQGQTDLLCRDVLWPISYQLANMGSLLYVSGLENMASTCEVSTRNSCTVVVSDSVYQLKQNHRFFDQRSNIVPADNCGLLVMVVLLVVAVFPITLSFFWNFIIDVDHFETYWRHIKPCLLFWGYCCCSRRALAEQFSECVFFVHIVFPIAVFAHRQRLIIHIRYLFNFSRSSAALLTRLIHNSIWATSSAIRLEVWSRLYADDGT